MRTPHKHAELIKAWADGAEIQGKHPSWDDWENAAYPSWTPEYEFRIKPETIRYRVALCCGGAGVRYPEIVGTEQQAAVLAGGHCFIDWLTDWVEVEV